MIYKNELSNSENDLANIMNDIGKRAQKAAQIMAKANNDQKNLGLFKIAETIIEHKDLILKANAQDVALAKEKNLSKPLIDRLSLDEKRINSMVAGIKEIADLADPVGKKLVSWHNDKNGLDITQISVPIGVIGVIYESRPNVTADASAITLKSGNVCILRGGSESLNSSLSIVNAIHEGLKKANLPTDAVIIIPTKERMAVNIMLKMNNFIDLIIPRGGKGLCELVQKESSIATLLHLDGNCHTYVHEDADIEKAVKIVHNAKLRRTGICGATESLVIDKKIAELILPKIIDSLTKDGCEIRGDKSSIAIDKRVKAAIDADWYTEYLDAIISVKIANDITEAIEFINNHSSKHTEAIITEDLEAKNKFLAEIQSAIVMHNTSTQFADGYEFGLGGEIGIATGKLHARGPVSAPQLTTYKYIVSSDAAIRPL